MINHIKSFFDKSKEQEKAPSMNKSTSHIRKQQCPSEIQFQPKMQSVQDMNLFNFVDGAIDIFSSFNKIAEEFANKNEKPSKDDVKYIWGRSKVYENKAQIWKEMLKKGELSCSATTSKKENPEEISISVEKPLPVQTAEISTMTKAPLRNSRSTNTEPLIIEVIKQPLPSYSLSFLPIQEKLTQCIADSQIKLLKFSSQASLQEERSFKHCLERIEHFVIAVQTMKDVWVACSVKKAGNRYQCKILHQDAKGQAFEKIGEANVRNLNFGKPEFTIRGIGVIFNSNAEGQFIINENATLVKVDLKAGHRENQKRIEDLFGQGCKVKVGAIKNLWIFQCTSQS